MKTIDINADLGESFGAYTIGNDEKLLPLVTSANVACGFHASDPETLIHTIDLVKQNNVALGAHPGYRDLEGFGRRDMSLSYKEVYSLVKYQLAAVDGLSKSVGVKMKYVKPHGALYNKSEVCEETRRAIIDSIYDYNASLYVMGMSMGKLVGCAAEKGLQVINEVFLDRAYNDNRTLVSRSIEGAMITDPMVASERIIEMIEAGVVKTITGKKIPIQVDSICVHGDTDGAVQFLKDIFNELKNKNYQFQSAVS
ncbi:5-oxoprolinase subunit PxpA [Phocicoccus pinnipedialis]|uniref:LamB/YcsF family protein n=1 Tax=Phocicoccus pinnipedialis TaxID=110845 RepID=A0A6V7RA87_9BACL|nr:5-oxoprolinase subunit PxpA [Jeotgalicoccus pinnipedialis]MBP1940179.1 UPF0271 protein [Jeotgalicoccus pinnipedialis]CAD2073878.1 LamB/YcsF family protein [Jeotgalicoccus pinnipedialis]